MRREDGGVVDGMNVSGLSSLDSIYSSNADNANSEVGVKVLKEAMNQAAESVLPLLEGLGQNLDVTA
ncbi:MAG: hypothetical protein COS94_00025 [Candidatus Hydrogenedentes bacterium CG07_land_8_20_14_0_80_42_17]|nr:MAG: hypothetical protein AUJ18_05615 [Candidatus Hydrogenedentes bacterium CG1_02_42_14]PIU48857.1 MAG: hypothetical protein COS94_00025 [Candidatus Hydrogenedentes bacterium CG07_land_8_20_14_0_80_42_17]